MLTFVLLLLLLLLHRCTCNRTFGDYNNLEKHMRNCTSASGLNSSNKRSLNQGPVAKSNLATSLVSSGRSRSGSHPTGVTSMDIVRKHAMMGRVVPAGDMGEPVLKRAHSSLSDLLKAEKVYKHKTLEQTNDGSCESMILLDHVPSITDANDDTPSECIDIEMIDFKVPSPPDAVSSSSQSSQEPLARSLFSHSGEALGQRRSSMPIIPRLPLESPRIVASGAVSHLDSRSSTPRLTSMGNPSEHVMSLPDPSIQSVGNAIAPQTRTAPSGTPDQPHFPTSLLASTQSGENSSYEVKLQSHVAESFGNTDGESNVSLDALAASDSNISSKPSLATVVDSAHNSIGGFDPFPVDGHSSANMLGTVPQFAPPNTQTHARNIVSTLQSTIDLQHLSVLALRVPSEGITLTSSSSGPQLSSHSMLSTGQGSGGPYAVSDYLPASSRVQTATSVPILGVGTASSTVFGIPVSAGSSNPAATVDASGGLQLPRVIKSMSNASLQRVTEGHSSPTVIGASAFNPPPSLHTQLPSASLSLSNTQPTLPDTIMSNGRGNNGQNSLESTVHRSVDTDIHSMSSRPTDTHSSHDLMSGTSLAQGSINAVEALLEMPLIDALGSSVGLMDSSSLSFSNRGSTSTSLSASCLSNSHKRASSLGNMLLSSMSLSDQDHFV